MNHMPARNICGLDAEELECLSRLACGQDCEAIAAGTGRDAAETHVLLESARQKLGAATRLSAVLAALRRGLLR